MRTASGCLAASSALAQESAPVVLGDGGFVGVERPQVVRVALGVGGGAGVGLAQLLDALLRGLPQLHGARGALAVGFELAGTGYRAA